MKLIDFIVVTSLLLLVSCNTVKNNNQQKGTATEKVEKQNKLTLDVFKGETAHVNTYLFSNGTSMIALDVQRSSEEAKN